MSLSLLLSSLLSSSATAGLWYTVEDTCTYFFHRIRAASYRPPVLTDGEKDIFTKAFGDSSEIPNIADGRLSSELFWYGYHQLPSEIRDILRRAPQNRSQQYLFFQSLHRQLEGTPLYRSFYDSIQTRWVKNNTFDRRSFRDWLAEGEADWKREPKSRAKLAELSGEWQSLVEEFSANRDWNRAYQIPVPYELGSRGRVTLTLRGQKVMGYRKGNSLRLKVPRELLAIRMDNPLNLDQLVRMAEAGVPSPSFWTVALGHDGKLYVDDGNHRLALDPRKEVWVEMSFPPKTQPLAVFLDFKGWPQPSREALIEVYRGRKGFRDLLPDTTRSNLQFAPEEELGF